MSQVIKYELPTSHKCPECGRLQIVSKINLPGCLFEFDLHKKIDRTICPGSFKIIIIKSN